MYATPLQFLILKQFERYFLLVGHNILLNAIKFVLCKKM